MGIADVITVLAVFGGFGLLIWSRLVKKNHPIVDKVRVMFKSKVEKEDLISQEEKWLQPHIERKIM